MTNLKIKEHKAYYTTFNKDSKLDEWQKDNLEDMQLLVQLLIDELYKAEDKQNQWFEKYWELKKQLNRITDVVNGE